MSNDNTKTLLTAAINLGIIDSTYLIERLSTAIYLESYTSATAIAADLDEIADALQHTDCETRAAWFAVRDALSWFATDQGGPDKFGFRAQAEATSLRALAAAGISA